MTEFKFIKNGICAPLGFTASGVHCGIKKGRDKKDLAIIKSMVLANAAAVYTTNLVKAAPILVTKSHLQNGYAQAIICNSGIANACVADGVEKAEIMASLAAESLKLKKDNIIIASTGVIGQSINLDPIKKGVEMAVKELSKSGSDFATEAIMTTDTFKKQIAVEFDIDGTTVRVGAIAKGSGMINPNMATMLGFITTDAKIETALLQDMLKAACDVSFNRVSVDGDTSTNDMLVILANGLSGAVVKDKSAASQKFFAALTTVCVSLAKMLAKDGEGATKLLECVVSGAPTKRAATLIADSIIASPLVKTAMFGEDANWGRILCAAGYSGAEFDSSRTNIFLANEIDEIQVCKNGCGINFCEESAKKILSAKEIIIKINLNLGEAGATGWGCDLSYDYVKINGDYRS